MKHKLLKLMKFFHIINEEKYKFLEQMDIVNHSLLFDAKWYLVQNPDVAEQKMNPAKHYIVFGWKEGRNPSIYFNTNDYCEANPDVKDADVCPLVHYELIGKTEKRTGGIADYIILRDIIKKSSYWDTKYYLNQNPDVKKAKVDPIEHYLYYGWKEGRNPSIYFNTNEYCEVNSDVKYADICPLVHYELAGRKEGRTGGVSEDIWLYNMIKKSKYWDAKYYFNQNPDVKKAKVDPIEHYLYHGWKEKRSPSKAFDDLPFSFSQNVNPVIYLEKHTNDLNGSEYVEYLTSVLADEKHFVNKIDYSLEYKTDTKLIAFYSPQHHVFKENEEPYGRKKNEWISLSKTMPCFIGHRQPQLPVDVDFYDLANTDVITRQTELAKLYGLYGFCFHYYWFSERKLMEEPIYNYLKHTEIDFPFCLCWTNENFSNLQNDGNEKNLIKQEFENEDDIKFAKDIIPFLQDKRYIRIDNKPLLIISQITSFEQKHFCEFINVLKSECKKNDIKDLFVLVGNSFTDNPKDWNIDGIVELPPYGVQYKKVSMPLAGCKNKLEIADAESYIKNKKYIYETNYNLYKTVFPSWDNSAQKLEKSLCFYGENPKLYRTWLSDCIDWTKAHHKKSDQLVFVNAWNKWMEGAHLEPDCYYGYAYLNETKNAIIDTIPNVNKIIYVGHDALFAGAELLTLNILKSLRKKFNYNIECLLLKGGELCSEYEKYANVTIVKNMSVSDIHELVLTLKNRGYDKAITNTIITGEITECLKENGVKVISLIHELPKLIRCWHAEKSGEYIAKYSDKIIFASTFVEKPFKEMFNPEQSKLVILPQGLYKTNNLKDKIAETRVALRKELSLPRNSKIVLFVGQGSKNKGADLFIDIMDKVVKKRKDIYFLFVGGIDERIKSENELLLKKNEGRIIFCGKQADTSKYYAGSDLFLLPSREDSFPSVVLEAFECGLPVVAFENAGGFVDIVNDNTGKLVEYENAEIMAAEIINLLENTEKLKEISKFNKALIREKFDWNLYVQKLLNNINSLKD